MKRILVLALGHLSNGEITIALESLKGVGAQDHELLFVSHEWGRKYVASFNVPSRTLDATDPRENKKAFAAILAEFKPDLLVCADVYTMEYASTWSGVDFAYLKSLGIPLGSFDEYEWESSDFKWDYMGAVPSRIKPDLIHDCDFLIRPCPLNKPVESDGRIVACQLLSPEPRSPRMGEAAWREALGIEPGRKVIFTVNSGWEFVNVSPNPQVAALIKWMPRILHNEIASAEGPIAVVHIGPKPWDFDIDPRLQYRYLARADSELYQECEMRADLFCGTNATSITLTKAAAALTPCLLFQNLKSLDFAALESIMPRMPAWYREMAAEVGKAAPFRIFPWGWANFLKTVFDSNPYSAAFAEAPVFMPDKCRKAIDTYLRDEAAIAAMKARQSAYFGSLSALSPVGEFLETIG